MKKNFMFRLLSLVCLVVTTMVLCVGCGTTTIGAGDWIQQNAIADRNWNLVGEAKDTVESRTISYKMTAKKYDFENEMWETKIQEYTVVRSGYKADRLYYVKTITTNITNATNETTTSEAYLGKVSNNSWMIYVYKYENGVKPTTPTTAQIVSTTAAGYETYLNKVNLESAVKVIFDVNSNEKFETYISKNIAQVNDFGEMDILLYSDLINASFENTGTQYKFSYSLDAFYGKNTDHNCEIIIKDGKFSSLKIESSAFVEELNAEGEIEVVSKTIDNSNISITYTGTVIMPVID